MVRSVSILESVGFSYPNVNRAASSQGHALSVQAAQENMMAANAQSSPAPSEHSVQDLRMDTVEAILNLREKVMHTCRRIHFAFLFRARSTRVVYCGE